MKPAILFFSVVCLMANNGALAQQGRYTYSNVGSEVTDSQTGLIWRRCAEGMAWSGGSCTGSPVVPNTIEVALAMAKTQAGWRLPNVKELSSIADRSRSDPAIDTVAFPATPPYFFWSSTPLPMYINIFITYGVFFSDGRINGSNTTTGDEKAVRLVR